MNGKDQQDLIEYLNDQSAELMHTLLHENRPRYLYNNNTSSLVSLRNSNSTVSNFNKSMPSKRNEGRQRRRSEDDGGVDFFLSKKELELDALDWDDIKNTRVGRKLHMQLNKKDRDILSLKDKLKANEEKHKA